MSDAQEALRAAQEAAEAARAALDADPENRSSRAWVEEAGARLEAARRETEKE